MSDEFFERRVGTVVKGKWTLEKLLGVGGMAAVYVGRHHIGRTDAIKILHPSAGRSSELRARFEQEARAVSQLGHPGVVRIDDIDKTEDGSLFMVMQLLDGESLGDRLERGGTSPADTLRWAEQILDVLEAAHALGIVHRDVKPDNVFVLNDGNVKLLDFGVAHIQGSHELKTSTGVALGTLPYMAPEQVRGEKVDARVDLFAVGATIVRAIARRPIHEAATEAELYLKMGTQPAPPARELLPGAPEAVWPIVDCALAFDREHRYATAREMREDVEAVRAGRLPAHALSGARLEPTVAPAAPAVRPTLDATLRSTVAERLRTTVQGLGSSPRRLLAVLGGSVALGVLLAVTTMLLATRACDGDAPAGASALPSGAPAPSAAPSLRRPPLSAPKGREPKDDDKDRKKPKEKEKKHGKKH